MKFFSIKPVPFFVFYLYAIFIPWVLYMWFSVDGDFNEIVNQWNRLYFSVVTITTLGYGDLTPVDPIIKTIASVQAMIGPVLIGLYFLKVAERIAETQRRNQYKQEFTTVQRISLLSH